MTDLKHDAQEHDGALDVMMDVLAGRGPGPQGALLGDLVSRWLAGHHPDHREDVLTIWVKMVRDLIPVQEKIVLGGHEWPKTDEEAQAILKDRGF